MLSIPDARRCCCLLSAAGQTPFSWSNFDHQVNLLDDHLVDVLLDSAASGWNTVEREGISISHPARFILVGSGACCVWSCLLTHALNQGGGALRQGGGASASATQLASSWSAQVCACCLLIHCVKERDVGCVDRQGRAMKSER
jgi:hypothetical protein